MVIYRFAFFFSKKFKFTQVLHSIVHYSTPGNSLDWVIDSSVSHHVTTDLAALSLHELYTAFDNVIIDDNLSLSITNISSFSLTSLLATLLFSNVLHVLSMSKNLVSVFALCVDNPINVLFFNFLLGAGSSHRGHSSLWAM